MGLFGRRSTSRLPADVQQMLERYGRWAFDPQHSGIDVATIGHEALQRPILEAYAEGLEAVAEATNRLANAFIEEVLPVGGWPIYGAYKLIDDIADGVKSTPTATVMEAGLQFLRERGVPWNTHLSPYEKRFWISHHPGGARDWIPWPDPPDPGLGPHELGADEVRHIATTRRADGVFNLIHARHGDEGFQAVITSADSDSEFVWYTEPSLYDLYLQVGGALCTPPHWSDEDLARFIPQPAMNLA